MYWSSVSEKGTQTPIKSYLEMNQHGILDLQITHHAKVQENRRTLYARVPPPAVMLLLGMLRVQEVTFTLRISHFYLK